MGPVSCRKSTSKLEDEGGEAAQLEEGLSEKSVPAIDVSRDPAMEQKILLKMEALRERLKQWTRRLDELVCY